MKKFLKSLKTALIITISLHVIALIAMYFIKEDWNEIWKDLIYILPISFSIFFFPPFLSCYLFKEEEENLVKILKPAIISFAVIYIIIYIYFTVIKKQHPFDFFETTSIMNGIIGFFLSVLFTIIQIINNKNSSFKRINRNIIYKIKYIVLIPVVATIIYSLIIYFNYNNIPISKIIESVTKLLILGIVTSFLSFYTLYHLYNNKINSKRIIYTIFLYAVLVSFMSIIEILFTFSIIEQKSINLFAILIRLLVIRGPFFLFIVTITHFYFIHLLNKQEKIFIKQESLESQLNYQQLKKQLSPHFLFNNINVLTALIEENPTKAIGFSERLSNIYRYFLEHEKQDVVLLEEELIFAKDYLYLLESRYEKGLLFEFSILEEDKKKYIVTNTLQQVLENVIKHNEISKDNPVTVKISSKKDYLIIENNKNKKISATKRFQKGIENIKKRNTYFSDKEVIIKSNADFFKIQIPLLNK